MQTVADVERRQAGRGAGVRSLEDEPEAIARQDAEPQEIVEIEAQNAKLESEISSAASVARVEGAAHGRLGLVPPSQTTYLELPDRGHSFPPEAEAEMFDVLRVKRLRDAKRSSAWPRSSFSRKVTPDEARYLGDPAAGWSAPASVAAGATLKDLLAELERGGGGAERAAAAIASEKPEGAAKAVVRVLKNAKATDDVRSYAARSPASPPTGRSRSPRRAPGGPPAPG